MVATRRTSFDKLQRERAKRAKQAAKREERQERAAARAEGEDGESVVDIDEELSAGELMQRLEDAHVRFENKEMDFETFEEEKRALLERLAALPLD